MFDTHMAVRFCCLIALACCLATAAVHLKLEDHENYLHITHHLLSKRTKRSYLGIQEGRAALSYLLKGAKHIQTFGDSGMFIKPGGYRAAIKDFKAVHPTHVEVVHDVRGIVRTSGMVGNKQIILEKGKGTKSTSVKITKNCCEFPKRKSRMDFNVIIYKDQ